jgi:hypothetical protein
MRVPVEDPVRDRDRRRGDGERKDPAAASAVTFFMCSSPV